MYLRHTTVGKVHTYWRVVRSVRRGRKVIQETVAGLDAQDRARARSLALKIAGGREQYGLFEATVAAGEPVAVRLECQIASKADPLFAAKSDPFGGAGLAASAPG
jgi:hypothetical protein